MKYTPFEAACKLSQGHLIDRKDLPDIKRTMYHLNVIKNNARLIMSQLKEGKQ